MTYILNIPFSGVRICYLFVCSLAGITNISIHFIDMRHQKEHMIEIIISQ